MLTVLYDGWPLVRQPSSPAALHLLALLASLPAQVQPIVALPEAAPAWFSGAVTIQPTGDSPGARLRWEQFNLPRLARALDARLLHFTAPVAPLFGPGLSVVSPTGYEISPADRRSAPAGLVPRLRAALAHGGLARAGALLWPADLPVPPDYAPAHLLQLPPLVHPSFFSAAQARPPDLGAAGEPTDLPDGVSYLNRRPGYSLPPLDLPETYILYHGPDAPADLDLVLQAWSWAAGPLGEQVPLLLTGLSAAAQTWLAARLPEYGLAGTVRPLPGVVPELLPGLYHGCLALFHPAPVSPWGGAIRHALAAARPVVACAGARAEALVGPAAYLAPAGDPRALGAALVTVIVEQSVADQLTQAARRRAAAWQPAGFGQALLQAYLSRIKTGDQAMS